MTKRYTFAPTFMLAFVATTFILLSVQSSLFAQGTCDSCTHDSIGWGYWKPNIICTNGGVEGKICDTILSNPSFISYTTQDTAPGTWELYNQAGDSIPVLPMQNCLTIVVPIWFCKDTVDSINFQFCLNSACGPISKDSISYTPPDSSNPIPGNGGFNFSPESGGCFKITGIKPVIDTLGVRWGDGWLGPDTLISTCYDQDFTFTICSIPPGCDSTRIMLTCTTFHDSTYEFPLGKVYNAPYTMITADTISVLTHEHWSHPLIMHPKQITGTPMAMIMYPNPAKNTPIETIEYTATEDGPITICLYTANARPVSVVHSTASKNVQTTYQLPIDNGYPDGMYICSIMQTHSIASQTMAVVR